MLLLKALLIKINDTLKNMIDDVDSEDIKKALRNRRSEITQLLYNVDEDDISYDPDDEKDKKIYVTFNYLINESNQELYKDELINIMKSVDFKEADSVRVDIKGKQKDNRLTYFFRNFKHFYFNEELNDPTYLNKFSKTLIKECNIISIKSCNVYQSLTIFYSLNSDGNPLTYSGIFYSKMYCCAS